MASAADEPAPRLRHPAHELPLREVRARTGLSGRQLRRWEGHGLLIARRTTGNQRVYTDDDVHTLLWAKRMRDAGMSLDDIQLVLRLSREGTLGLEGFAISRVLVTLASMRAQLSAADEILRLVQTRLVRRSGSQPPAIRAGPSTTGGSQSADHAQTRFAGTARAGS